VEPPPDHAMSGIRLKLLLDSRRNARGGTLNDK
jgi:hypothetical protein